MGIFGKPVDGIREGFYRQIGAGLAIGLGAVALAFAASLYQHPRSEQKGGHFVIHAYNPGYYERDIYNPGYYEIDVYNPGTVPAKQKR